TTAGKPDVMTGIQPSVLNRTSIRRPRCAVKRTACNASQQWIGADNNPAAINLCELHGRIAVPMFFWGGQTTRATGNGCMPTA
ncbi:hypothetical protein, partial [Caballeronia sp. BR00000012568055]|uniref:hypothetical protein n=1 Tax=Caballeronia sp. BR00000012568055 TaxID=2918761 RepID=UPI0023FA005A